MKLMPISGAMGVEEKRHRVERAGFSFLCKKLNLLGASPLIGDDASNEHAYLPLCRRAVIAMKGRAMVCLFMTSFIGALKLITSSISRTACPPNEQDV
jgi:hypothetical protein